MNTNLLLHFTFLTVLSCAFGAHGDEEIHCKEGFEKVNGSCYLAECSKLSWTAAQDFCEMHGGSLVVIDNADEHEALMAWLKAKNIIEPFWTGLMSIESYRRAHDHCMLPRQCSLDFNGDLQCYSPDTAVAICEHDGICDKNPWPNCKNNSDFIQIGDKFYGYFTARKQYFTADFYCKNLGAKLAEPKSAQETQALIDAFGPRNESFYLGMNDVINEGDWVYLSDGSPIDPGVFFAPGQPDNDAANPDSQQGCAIYNDNFLGLDDVPCIHRRNYVCECY